MSTDPAHVQLATPPLGWSRELDPNDPTGTKSFYWHAATGKAEWNYPAGDLVKTDQTVAAPCARCNSTTEREFKVDRRAAITLEALTRPGEVRGDVQCHIVAICGQQVRIPDGNGGTRVSKCDAKLRFLLNVQPVST